jgi:hypothetical protein
MSALIPWLTATILMLAVAWYVGVDTDALRRDLRRADRCRDGEDSPCALNNSATGRRRSPSSRPFTAMNPVAFMLSRRSSTSHQPS